VINFRAKRRVRHTPELMFELVADVERYPEFVPFCRAHVVKSRESQAGADVLITDMTVSYGPFREGWRSRVTLQRSERCIQVVSANGPFRRLETRWTFRSLPDGACEVGLSLDYELGSPSRAILVATLFDAQCLRILRAFELRAYSLYGHNANDTARLPLGFDPIG
jgi:coenzyme Q-binding protein COQ10